MSSDQRHLWLNQQAPLLKIVEQSNNSKAVQWAYELLKKEYRLEMKDVSPKWLYRISQSKYDFTHKLALDYLQNATGVEEGMYYQQGYHKAIIGFLGLDRIQHGNAEIDFAISYLQSVGANPENTWLTSELPLDEIVDCFDQTTQNYVIWECICWKEMKESQPMKMLLISTFLQCYSKILERFNCFEANTKEIHFSCLQNGISIFY